MNRTRVPLSGCLRAPLVSALSRIGKVVPSAGTTGATADTVFFLSDAISAWNGEQYMRVPVHAPIVGGVQYSLLLGLLRSLTTERLDITCTDTTVTITEGEKKAVLSLSGEPEMTPPEVRGTQLPLTPHVVAGLRYAGVIVNDKAHRVNAQGTTLMQEGQEVVCYATDLVSIRRVVVGSSAPAIPSVILPKRCCSVLAALWNEQQQEDVPGDVALHIEDTQVSVQCGDAYMSSATITGEGVLDYASVYAPFNPDGAQWTEFPESLHTAISRLHTVWRGDGSPPVAAELRRHDGQVLLTYASPRTSMEDAVAIDVPEGLEEPQRMHLANLKNASDATPSHFCFKYDSESKRTALVTRKEIAEGLFGVHVTAFMAPSTDGS